MKKLVPYILFSATALHTIIGISPIMAMSCSSHSNSVEVTCEEGDVDCKQNKLENSVN